MKIILQRVEHGSVFYEENTIVEIGKGLVIYVGISKDEDLDAVGWLLDNIRRRMEDGDEILLLSQFTLFATFKCKKPSFHKAERPEKASEYFSMVYEKVKNELPCPVKRGLFGKHLQIDLKGKNITAEFIENGL